MEVVIHKKGHFGAQHNVRLQRGTLDYRCVGLERFHCIGTDTALLEVAVKQITSALAIRRLTTYETTIV